MIIIQLFLYGWALHYAYLLTFFMLFSLKRTALISFKTKSKGTLTTYLRPCILKKTQLLCLYVKGINQNKITFSYFTNKTTGRSGFHVKTIIGSWLVPIVFIVDKGCLQVENG